MSASMDSFIREEILRAEALARSGHEAEALAVASMLASQHPGDAEVWALRAYLNARGRGYAQAIADLGRAIAIDGTEPQRYFDRGRYALAAGQPEAALQDFTKGLELCDQFHDDYYRESLHFLRAEALLQLGRKSEAREDLEQVRDDYEAHIKGMRSKRELLKECES